RLRLTESPPLVPTKRKSKDCREESSSTSQSLDFEGSAVPGFSGTTVSVQPSTGDSSLLESSGVGAKAKARRDRPSNPNLSPSTPRRRSKGCQRWWQTSVSLRSRNASEHWIRAGKFRTCCA